jgi:hypothetical protein
MPNCVRLNQAIYRNPARRQMPKITKETAQKMMRLNSENVMNVARLLQPPDVAGLPVLFAVDFLRLDRLDCGILF